MSEDFIHELRTGKEWLNGGECCGDVDIGGQCAAPACVFDEALKYFYKSADAIEKLEKFKKLVEFIANDYHELSHDKAQWQRDDWKKRCKKLIEEYYENTDSI